MESEPSNSCLKDHWDWLYGFGSALFLFVWRIAVSKTPHQHKISKTYLDGVSFVNSNNRNDKQNLENAYPEQRKDVINRVNIIYDRAVASENNENTASLYFTHRAGCDQLARKLRGDDEKGQNT